MEGGSSELLGTPPVYPPIQMGTHWGLLNPPFTLLSLPLANFQRRGSRTVGDKRNVRLA
ncbi:hypothetical protein [Xenorhabdus griffiniae]|uniref:Uncharacterized protein n=1 Tax=Xenorhabdus griffiniae TaxID=351672 RepID=A0ABY9XNF8_9GAMM|nr:hypothetical protein [Xenorhabdus griffiniae]MBD1226398.1 hypothetical protein [Xenorhabdus griffiniae]MBE8588717.1 hypothetical protein [Xenorhabdus griffiniae]WMV74341.1 hypothetical protein QL128_10280 [Xenorhabdus griffiniae]WNH04021.1 hypothetical protein QL112_010285 [Xenorhabdus griffiniae]